MKKWILFCFICVYCPVYAQENSFDENEFREKVTKIAQNVLVEKYPDITIEGMKYEKQYLLQEGEITRRLVTFELENIWYCNPYSFVGCYLFLIVESSNKEDFVYNSHFFHGSLDNFMYIDNGLAFLVVTNCENRGMWVAFSCDKQVILFSNGTYKELISFDEFGYSIGDNLQIGEVLQKVVDIQRIGFELYVYVKTLTLLSFNHETLGDDKYEESILLIICEYDKVSQKLVKKKAIKVK